MLKRITSLILVSSLLLFNFTFSFAVSDEFLEGHWAKDMIDKDFADTYFSCLIDSNDCEFEPDSPITKNDFVFSLYSLMSYHDSSVQKRSDVTGENFSEEGELLRKDAVKLIISNLYKTNNLDLTKNIVNPFTDLENLSDEYILYILNANKSNIVTGYCDNTFKPDDPVTKVQAMILLQRLKGVLDMDNFSIPFTVTKNDSSYSSFGKIVDFKSEPDKALLTISYKFPTSGYSMSIESITKISDVNLKVKVNVKSPNPNLMVAQVINYKSITVEVDKIYLDKDSYNINVIWNNGISKLNPNISKK